MLRKHRASGASNWLLMAVTSITRHPTSIWEREREWQQGWSCFYHSHMTRDVVSQYLYLNGLAKHLYKFRVY
uniref:Uncharacterized protein n=1 Tax=Populus trichocarpa TaxID=3694 RepID=A0A3N7FSS5_POPTR